MRKALSALMALITAHFGASIPSAIHNLLGFAVLLIILDTITGTRLAFLQRKISSKISREKLVNKLLGYAVLFLIFCGLGWIFYSYAPVLCIVAYLAYNEFTSIVENLVLMQEFGGANIAPLKPALDWAAKRLAVGTMLDIKTTSLQVNAQQANVEQTVILNPPAQKEDAPNEP